MGEPTREQVIAWLEELVGGPADQVPDGITPADAVRAAVTMLREDAARLEQAKRMELRNARFGPGPLEGGTR